MFNINKNYNEIMLNQTRYEYIPKWKIRQVCPKCGSVLSLDDKGDKRKDVK